ncbi:AGAP003214-PA-like protein [Anopheles sinensis]|uniref:AGAP003214-PA-like protein n=1 Tax=Anopheles sinensis TaxID=74873 RepID=A0A084WSL0_ANOSI|nr:AGAP003214-PA-like protein [Anopheles sinensis]
MALWNELNLTPPTPMNKVVSLKNIQPDVLHLANTTVGMLEYFSSMRMFETSAAYVSRFCYVWRLPFRNMHGFQVMRRLDKTLHRIKGINIYWDVHGFHEFLAADNYTGKEVKLPVRSNLEYLLVRLQGLIKLFMRVVYLAKDAASYQLKLINASFFFHHNALFLSSMGELWSLARNACRKLNKFYTGLYAGLRILPEADEPWLPKDYHLPASLAKWLGSEWDQEIVPIANLPALDVRREPTLMTIMRAKEGGDEGAALEKINSIVTNVDEPFIKEESPEREVETPKRPSDDEEVVATNAKAAVTVTPAKRKLGSANPRLKAVSDGEVVDAAVRPAKRSRRFDASVLNDIKSKFHVKQFLEEDRAKRSDKLKQAITWNVSEDEFTDFYARLMKEFNRLSSGEFVSLFKKEFIQMVGEE